jgi:hypothetical protein
MSAVAVGAGSGRDAGGFEIAMAILPVAVSVIRDDGIVKNSKNCYDEEPRRFDTKAAAKAAMTRDTSAASSNASRHAPRSPNDVGDGRLARQRHSPASGTNLRRRTTRPLEVASRVVTQPRRDGGSPLRVAKPRA